MHKIGSFLKRHIAWLLPLSILVVGAAAAGAVWYNKQQAQKPANNLADCQGKDVTCYRNYINDKVAKADPVATFADLRQAYNTDSFVVNQCHELAHMVGHAAFAKYSTIANAYTKGDNFCWSGYYHGVTEEAIGKMGADKVRQTANDICAGLASKAKYSFDHYNCVHGLGHGFMAVESFDIFKALKTCDTLKDAWDKDSCYGGVFMENVMVVVRGNGSSPHLKPDQPLYPCTAVEEAYKSACYLMQTSYVLQQNSYDFAETFKLCRDMKDSAFTPTCYQSIGRDASGSTNSDSAKTKVYCDLAPDAMALENCMLGAMRNAISYYHDDAEAKRFCEMFADPLKTTCLTQAAEYYKAF